MTHAVGYAATLLTFLIIDAVWISTVTRPVFERNIGEFMLDQPRLGAAALFYTLYVAGILYFAVMPALSSDSMRLAVINGAVLGVLAYGTYEATNFATMKGWAWSMVAIDVAWGAALTAVAAWVGYCTYRWMTG